MRPQECMRVQGIGKRNLHGIAPNKVREMVGNSMHVDTVSAIVRAAFQTMKSFELFHSSDKKVGERELDQKRMDPVSIAAATTNQGIDPGGVQQLHYQNFRLRKGSCFKEGTLDSVIRDKLKKAGFIMSDKGLLVYKQMRLVSPCLLLVHAHKVSIALEGKSLTGLPYRLYLVTGNSIAISSSGPHEAVSAIAFKLSEVGRTKATPILDSITDDKKNSAPEKERHGSRLDQPVDTAQTSQHDASEKESHGSRPDQPATAAQMSLEQSDKVTSEKALRESLGIEERTKENESL